MCSGGSEVTFGSGLSRLEPLLKGGLTLLGPAPGNDISDADIFIYVRPIDALAIPDEPMIVPFLPRSMQETGIPAERDRYGPPVVELHPQAIFGDLYLRNVRNLYLNC